MIRRKGIRWEYNGDGRFSVERIDRFWDALEALLRKMHAEDPLAAAPSRKVVSIV